MKEAMEFDEFKEAFRDAYYDALAYKKDVVVDGYTFFRKWYVLNYFLDNEALFPGHYTVEREVESVFADDSYAETFYDFYLQCVKDDNEIEQTETEKTKIGKDDL